MADIPITARYMSAAAARPGGWEANNGYGGHEMVVVLQFDLRAFAAQVRAKYPNSYMTFAGGHANMDEHKHGWRTEPVYAPNVPSNQGWRPDPTSLPHTSFYYSGRRGSLGAIDGDSRHNPWTPWTAGMENAPIPMADLQTSPLWIIYDCRDNSRKHNVTWSNFTIEYVRMFEIRPGFPGWAGDMCPATAKRCRDTCRSWSLGLGLRRSRVEDTISRQFKS